MANTVEIMPRKLTAGTVLVGNDDKPFAVVHGQPYFDPETGSVWVYVADYETGEPWLDVEYPYGLKARVRAA